MSVRYFLLFTAIILLPVVARSETVLWEITPAVADGAVTHVDLVLRFEGSALGETEIALPDEWGGERELYRGLSGFQAEGASLLPGDAPARLRLTHEPGATITLSWQIGAGEDNPPDTKQGYGNDYRARFAPDHFLIIGYTALAKPAHISDTAPAEVRLHMPEGLHFVSDLEHGAAGRFLTMNDLKQSVLFGGDIRIIDAGNGGRLALAGSFDHIADTQWQESFLRIAADQRAYWHTGAEPFLVTVSAMEMPPGHYSVGGTGLGDAFALFASRNMRFEDAEEIVAHEMMHSWIPNRIGRMPEDEQPASYWLSEGFTNWVTWRTLVRGGIWTPQVYAEAFNKSVAAHDISPVRHATGAEISAGFWRSRDLQALPYHRGMLIAVWLDLEIRERTGGRLDLDDILLAMQDAAPTAPETLVTDLLVQKLSDATGWDAREAIEAAALSGADIVLPTDVFAPCGEIVLENQPAWERGFDFDATAAAGWIVQGTARGSRAWEAGLRNGMQLIAWSETSADYESPSEKTAKVSVGGQEVELIWLPARREARPVRKLRIAENVLPQATVACQKRLGGL